MSKKPGFETEVVIAFLNEAGERGEDGRLMTINGQRVLEAQRSMIEGWTSKPTIELGKVDALLMRYGLMLWELEHFAEQAFGRSGFVDPYADPKELVA